MAKQPSIRMVFSSGDVLILPLVTGYDEASDTNDQTFNAYTGIRTRRGTATQTVTFNCAVDSADPQNFIDVFNLLDRRGNNYQTGFNCILDDYEILTEYENCEAGTIAKKGAEGNFTTFDVALTYKAVSLEVSDEVAQNVTIQ